jgi:arsenite methyltransferase
MQFDAEAAARIEAVYQTPDVVEQRARTLERLALKPGERVLDLGCGPGLLAVEMANAVGAAGHVEAIDSSPSMLVLAERRAAALENVHFWQADVTALPFEDASFDAAVCVQVYEFVPDIALALRELRRVLKPGGRAVVIDTDWESCVWHSGDDARMQLVLASWDRHCPHPHLPRELGPLMRAAGLDVESVGVIPIVNTTHEPQTYSFGAIDMIAAHARTRLDPGIADAWADDLRAIGARGEYFFSLNRFAFTARRPAA